MLAYALANPKEGYRRLTRQMIDADVARLSESSVYRILNDVMDSQYSEPLRDRQAIAGSDA